MRNVLSLHRLELDEYGNVTGGAQARDHLRDEKHASHLPASPSPGGRARGLYDPKADYSAMDVVAFNGSEWRAKVDNPGPLPGDGWMLGAKGSRGKPGERGIPGVSVTTLDLVGFTLVVSLSDETTLHCNLLPAFESFERER